MSVCSVENATSTTAILNSISALSSLRFSTRVRSGQGRRILEEKEVFESHEQQFLELTDEIRKYHGSLASMQSDTIGSMIAAALASILWLTVASVLTAFFAGAYGVQRLSVVHAQLDSMRRDLARAADKALAASEAKGQFLANMSHEIWTPMSGIVGSVGLLLESGLGKKQTQYVTTVQTCVRTLLHLDNEILDLSKIEAGKLELESTGFSVRDMLRGTTDMISGQAAERDLRILLQVEPTVHQRVQGDPHRIGQVVVNLLTNAVKFSSGGEIAVRLCVEEHSAKQSSLRFEVSDNGIGISDDRLPVIFDVFIQADSSTTRQFGGSGVGLTICRQLVELMGGRIGVNSVPGEGSTFWFTVPLEKADRPTAPVQQWPASKPEDLQRSAVQPGLDDSHKPRQSQPSFADKRLLLVDDNEMGRELSMAILERLGVPIDCAKNGLEAVEAVGANTYDIILMDCQMPLMDGFQATTEIRRRFPMAARVPIIALTAFAMASDRERCMAAGMTDYLAKPIEPAVLREKVTAWLLAEDGMIDVAAAKHKAIGEDRRYLELVERCAGDVELAHRLFDLLIQFANDLEHKVFAIRKAVEDGDLTAAADLAHGIKGVAGSLAALEVSDLAGQIESFARRGEKIQAASLVDEFGAATDRLRAEMATLEGTRDTLSDVFDIS